MCKALLLPPMHADCGSVGGSAPALELLASPLTSLYPPWPALGLQIAALLEAEYTPEEVAAIGLTPPAELAALLDSLS